MRQPDKRPEFVIDESLPPRPAPQWEVTARIENIPEPSIRSYTDKSLLFPKIEYQRLLFTDEEKTSFMKWAESANYTVKILSINKLNP